MHREKKGIAAWLASPENARRTLLGILRTERSIDTTVDRAAADALEELSELHEKSAEELRQLLAGFAGQENTPAARADIAAALHGYFSRAVAPSEFDTAEEKRDEAKRDLAAAKEPACTCGACLEALALARATAGHRKVTSCQPSCPFSDGVAGEWCRRYNRFNPPHELEAWGRPEWCESGDIVITIEETEIEDDLGDRRVNYTSDE